MVPPTHPPHLALRQVPREDLLTVIQTGRREEISLGATVNQSNTGTSTERKGRIDLVQTPVKTLMLTTKAALTSRTEAQDEDMTPVTTGTTKTFRGTTDQTGPRALQLTFHTERLPAMTRKGEVEKLGKIT